MRILTPDMHRKLGWRSVKTYAFARDFGLIPISAQELPLLAQDVPVAFRKLGVQWQAVAIFCPVQTVNLLVEAGGHWLGSFVPGVLRSYPFELSAIDKTLAFWQDCDPEETGAEGVEPGFVDGHLTTTLTATLAFLQELDKGIEWLHALLSWLAERDVLRPLQIPGFSERLDLPQHTDLFALDHCAMKGLTEADWFDLSQKVSVAAVLSLMHAHLSSLEFIRCFEGQPLESDGFLSPTGRSHQARG